MKKIVLGITMASLILCLVGCGSNNANNAANEAGNAVQDAANGAGNAAKDVAEGAGNAVKDAANGAGNAVKGFGGAINYAWSDVADEFGKVENDINLDSASKDDIRGLVSTISDNYDKVKNGVYDNNKDAAKKMYEAGNKLEAIGKGKTADENLSKLGSDTKAMVKHYFGEGNEHFDKVSKRFEGELETAKKL